jgi:hypothetical protein
MLRRDKRRAFVLRPAHAVGVCSCLVPFFCGMRNPCAAEIYTAAGLVARMLDQR